MVESSDSDSDIEIIATKETKRKILQSKEEDETIKDLENIENQEEHSGSSVSNTVHKRRSDDINISISKSAMRRTKNMNITISMVTESEKSEGCSSKKSSIVCIDSDSEGNVPQSTSSSKVKVVVSDGKRKHGIHQPGLKKFKTEHVKSTSELYVENNDSASLSTSEMFLENVDNSDSMDDSDDDSDDEKKNELRKVKELSVKDCVESFLNSCRRLLPPEDHVAVKRKVLKHLNKLDAKHLHNNNIKNFLDLKWSLLDSDKSNIFVHVKEVIEELKKYRGEGFTTSSGATTSDFSDPDVKSTKTSSSLAINSNQSHLLDMKARKRVSLTTLCPVPQTDRKVTDEELSSVDRILKKPKENPWMSLASGKSSESEEERDDNLLISLCLEKKSPIKVAAEEAQPEDKTKLQVFNKNLTCNSKYDKEDEASGSSSLGKTASDKHIRKLEKALKACAKQIEKCEEAEIDWDNDDDSTFVMADRWKKKFMSIYNKLAQYRGESKDLERSSDKKFKFLESKYPEVNKKIEKFVNKTKSFPDFWDIKKQIEKVNFDRSLNLTDMQMHNEAEKIFIAVGKKLKKRRNIDDGTVMYSYLKPDDSGDPAAEDRELDNKLVELGKVAEQKINKVFEEYVEKQASGAKPAGGEDDNSDEDSDTEPEDENITMDNLSEGDRDEATVNDIVDLDDDDENDEVEDDAQSNPRSDSSSGSLNNLLEESDHE